MIVSVFGAAKPVTGDEDYELGVQLGKLLAESGHTVMTGGYVGFMEAISKGANEAGGHVIGATCTEIESWRPMPPNPWILEEIRSNTLHERLDSLIEHCDAAIAMPGGIGTLAEILLMWNRLAIESIEQKPLIMLGKSWHTVLHTFYEEMKPYVKDVDWELVQFAATPELAAQMINEYQKTL